MSYERINKINAPNQQGTISSNRPEPSANEG